MNINHLIISVKCQYSVLNTSVGWIKRRRLSAVMSRWLYYKIRVRLGEGRLPTVLVSLLLVPTRGKKQKQKQKQKQKKKKKVNQWWQQNQWWQNSTPGTKLQLSLVNPQFIFPSLSVFICVNESEEGHLWKSLKQEL